MTHAQFKRLQLRERNEFFLDAIRAHNGNLRATARALGMHRFVLCRYVKQFALVENYGGRAHVACSGVDSEQRVGA